MITPVRTSKSCVEDTCKRADGAASPRSWPCWRRSPGALIVTPTRRRGTGRRRLVHDGRARGHVHGRLRRLEHAGRDVATTPTAGSAAAAGTSPPPRPRRHGGRPDQGAVHLAGPARLVPGDRPSRHDRRTVHVVAVTLEIHGPGDLLHLARPTASSTAAWRRSTTWPPATPTGSGCPAPTATSTTSCRARFTLSTQPYFDATIGTDNRHWPGADDLTAGPRRSTGTPRRGRRRGPLVQVPGRPRPGRQGRPRRPARRLRRRALRRHRQGLRPAGQRRRPGPAGRRVRGVAPGSAAPRCPSTPPRSRRSRPRTTPPSGQQFAPRIYAPAGLRAPGLRPAGLRAAGLRARASTRRGSTRPAPTSRDLSSDPAFQRRLLGRPEPDAAGRLGQHRHQRTRSSRPPPATPTAPSTSASRATTTRPSTPTRRSSSTAHARRRRPGLRRPDDVPDGPRRRRPDGPTPRP